MPVCPNDTSIKTQDAAQLKEKTLNMFPLQIPNARIPFCSCITL